MKSPYVYFLPKSAVKVVITYLEKDVAISIICSSHSKEIRADFIQDSGRVISSKLMVDAPELCMTHFLIEDYFALNTHQNEKLCPYVFANVFESGAICFGDFFDRCPRDLRQAWNYYWETPFNRENSGYYEYHRDRCIGISSHSQAGHREGKCICACCVEICNCPCYCVQSHLFEQYLKECPSREFSFEENPQIIGKDSVILEVLSSQLIVIPKEIGTRLGLKGTKYPDIFLFVQREDETNYHCEVDQQPIIIPKALVQNGTAKTT